MDWRVKAVVQGLLAKIPTGTVVNDLLQRAVGGRRDEGAHIDTTFEADWLVHQHILRDMGFRVQDRHARCILHWHVILSHWMQNVFMNTLRHKICFIE